MRAPRRRPTTAGRLPVLGGWAATSVASAQPAPPAPTMPDDPTRYLLQALLSLVIVVALIYLLYWLLRRFGAGRGGGATVGPAQLIQSLPLQNGYALHLVRVGQRMLAVVCGMGGVTAVALDDDDPGTAPPVTGREREDTL